MWNFFDLLKVDQAGRGVVGMITNIKTYCRIVTALEKTIEIRKDIDALYPKVETDLLDMDLTTA